MSVLNQKYAILSLTTFLMFCCALNHIQLQTPFVNFRILQRKLRRNTSNWLMSANTQISHPYGEIGKIVLLKRSIMISGRSCTYLLTAGKKISTTGTYWKNSARLAFCVCVVMILAKLSFNWTLVLHKKIRSKYREYPIQNLLSAYCEPWLRKKIITWVLLVFTASLDCRQ